MPAIMACCGGQGFALGVLRKLGTDDRHKFQRFDA